MVECINFKLTKAEVKGPQGKQELKTPTCLGEPTRCLGSQRLCEKPLVFKPYVYKT